MITKRFFIGLGILAVGLIVAFFSLGLKNDGSKARQKRKSPMYQGLPAKTIRSESVFNATDNQLFLPAVLQGDVVEHDIVIRNHLKGPLQLKDVKSCCGFLLKHYSRRIAKNGRGKISLLVITDKFGGKTVKGNIVGQTNDPQRATLAIEVVLPVEEFAAILPHTIELKGVLPENPVGVSRIIPLDKYPFKITGIKAKKGYFFNYNFRQAINAGRKEYVIHVKNTVKKASIYRDVLFVQTDHPARPELKIRVKGKITD